ncbi:succinate dehydrogenase, hydrophobic membrane anchor protein [Gammaproteobacteria bacterium]|nr:succinate dehydrogenase, hydrophobic membrane anchor protein [Gammaproteobacteria bacterium]
MKGSLIWYAQRYSSILILIYVAYVFYFLFSNGQISYFDWTMFILSFEMRAFTSLISLLIILHSFIGLWTVGTDYLTKRTLGFLNKSFATNANIIRNVYYSLFVGLGALYLMVILYIIWL